MSYNDSNSLEKIEMSYRAVGREYNWELNNYINADKTADRGNRRRFLKNVARFFKNPFGYVYWRMPRNCTKFQPFALFLGVSSFLLFVALIDQTKEKQKETAFLVTKGY